MRINGVANRQPCGSPWCTWERVLVKPGAVGIPLAGGSGCRLVLQGHLLGRRRAFNGTAECHLVLPPAANPEPVRLATQVHVHMNWIEHCRKEATRRANVETAGNRDNSRRVSTSHKQGLLVPPGEEP